MTVGNFIDTMLDASRYRYTIYQDDGGKKLRFEPVIVNAQFWEVFDAKIGNRRIRTWTLVREEMFIEVYRDDGKCKR